MNKKTLGSSIRRGVLTGTVAGFIAGWTAFVGHAKTIDQVQNDNLNDVEIKRANVLLPPVPALPDLGAEPGAASYRVGYGPSGPLPRVAGGAPAPAPAAPAPQAPQRAAPVAPAPPPPAFAPLPALPPAPAAPAPVTRPTPPKP